MLGFLVLPDGSEVVARDGLVLGRVAGCDVVVNDTKASRRHAALRVAGSVVEIEDLDSSNGTLLNGKKVQKFVLRDGDRIQIGAWAIAYREGNAASPKAIAVAEELTFDDEPTVSSSAPSASPPSVRPASSPPIVPAAPLPPAPEPPRRSAPPPPPAPTRAPAAASDTLEFLDEVVQLRTSAPTRPSPSALASGAAKPQPASAVRERGVLQFNKQSNREGLLADDMQQMSSVKRALLVLVALAVTGMMGYLAMQLAR